MGEENIIFEKAKNKALSSLARRMYTGKELCDKLIKYQIAPEIAAEAVEWAKEYGFVNDLEYARMYINECINSKKYGMRRIKQALIYKGIDAYTIEDALAEVEFEEREMLIPLVEKKLAGNFDRKNVDKVIRHFAGRGYSFSDIKSAIGQIKDDIEFAGSDDFE